MFKKVFPKVFLGLLILALTVPVQAKNTIRIAVIYAETGVAVDNNSGLFKTADMAVKDINASGGVLGMPLEIIRIDNKSTGVGSKEAALKAVELNVTAVVGAAWSSHALAMAPVLQEKGIPFITSVATNPKVTPIGDYIFRVCFTDPFQGKVLAEFARKRLKAKTAVILTDIQSDYSLGLTESFKESFKGDDLEILWEGEYGGKDADFSSQITKVIEFKPDVIFLPGHDRDSGLIIKQARNMGVKAIFLGGDGFHEGMYKYGDESIEGNFFSTHWHPEAPFPIGQKVKKEFSEIYGQSIKVYDPLGYDAFIVLADAIKRAGSLDRKAIRDAIAKTDNLETSTGTITFDENGDPLNKDAVILEFKDGGVAFVEAIKP